MKRILVLDDEQDILDVIVMILSDEGYQAQGIENGGELFNKIERFQPDLILMDVMLGNYDGRLLCNEIKSTPATSHIPVIMISASHELNSMIDKFCKPNDFLAKPFDIDDLTRKVKYQLDLLVSVLE